MKYFACADIHGCWYALQNAIITYGYDETNPNHQLIVCGDSFGRAATYPDDIIQVYKYLTSPRHTNPPIVLRGNHEDILIKIFRRGFCTYTDCYNGEDRTIAALADVAVFEARTHGITKEVAANYPEFEEWLNSLPYYFETENHVFVHGWIPRAADMQWFREASEDEWIEASWCNTEDRIYYMPENGYDKTLVFGHWGTYRLRGEDWTSENHDIWFDEKRKLVGLDNTTVVSSYMNMYVVDDEPVAAGKI